LTGFRALCGSGFCFTPAAAIALSRSRNLSRVLIFSVKLSAASFYLILDLSIGLQFGRWLRAFLSRLTHPASIVN
jgi:predicted membrane-bound dolichyl-phosphate-mannose-protein mannosyltransferase